MVLEKTSESRLDCKEIKPVHPRGNQLWIFIGRTDAEAGVPTLWPPDVKSLLTGQDPDAGKDWRQEKKDNRGWDGWMASLTQWSWVWANLGRQWRTAKPSVLQSMGVAESDGPRWLSRRYCVVTTAQDQSHSEQAGHWRGQRGIQTKRNVSGKEKGSWGSLTECGCEILVCEVLRLAWRRDPRLLQRARRCCRPLVHFLQAPECVRSARVPPNGKSTGRKWQSFTGFRVYFPETPYF